MIEPFRDVSPTTIDEDDLSLLSSLKKDMSSFIATDWVCKDLAAVELC